jgi:mono/diheme cytochrome c family protein
MNTLRGRSTLYLLASLLLVSVAWWGCGGGGGTTEEASEGTGYSEPSTETAAEEAEETVVGEVSVAAGEVVYLARCALCHGETGKGDGPAGRALDPKPRDHTDGSYMSTLTDEDIKTQIMDGKGAMPPHKDLINEQELESVILYVRSLSQ